jgi:hypothetical protein
VNTTKPSSKYIHADTAIPNIEAALNAGANIDPGPGSVGMPLRYTRIPSGTDQLAMYLNQECRRESGRMRSMRKKNNNSLSTDDNGV